jgi:hypothetical protein
MGFAFQEFLEDINGPKGLRAASEAARNAGEKYVPTESIDAIETMLRSSYGDYSMGYMNIKEAITSTDVVKLIPKVIEGKLREAAEPEYLGSKFFNVIHQTGGASAVYVFPIVGELVAHEVGEGMRYKESNLDFNTGENATLEIRTKKFGCRVSITEEALNDSTWDLFNLNVRKMGQAMARLKEEQVFETFTKHGHVLFDNALRQSMPEAATTGLGKDGKPNDTLSVEDFLDMSLALMGQGYQPTDCIMHPLVWVVFARNSMIGNGLTYGAFGGNYVHPNGAIQGTPAAFGMANNGNGQKMIMKPEDIQNRLPMPMNIDLSPWVNFDRLNKTFDMYIIDRSDVGAIVQVEGLQSDNWTDPERDIRLLKCKERYGIGLYNNGRAITVCRNIAVAPSYPANPVINIHPVQE